MTCQDRRTTVAAEFMQRFATSPTLWVRAPGRVDLMGSHTDYNDGFVLTMTIDREVWIAACPRSDRRVTIYSLNLPGGGSFDLDDIQHDAESHWTDYVRGVAVTARRLGLPVMGFDGLIHSTVPVGGGVSSSAALEVATAILFKHLASWEIEPLQMALLCQQAENHFVGMKCGILDQYTSVLGEAGCALLLDCRHLTSRPVPIHAGLRVVICDTRAKRELTGSEYAQRRAQCEAGVARLAELIGSAEVRALRDVTSEQFEALRGDLPEAIRHRCRFIVEENERVLRMEQALPAGDGALCTLMRDSYLGARDLFEIGSAEMEVMVEAMLGAPGVVGARQAGAGFGGCMVALVRAEAVEAFAAQVRSSYEATTGIEPSVYPVQAVGGAGLLEKPS